MKDRISAKPNRRLIIPENSTVAPFYATVTRADEPTQEGTPLNKGTLLSDMTAALLDLQDENATPDKALAALFALSQGGVDLTTLLSGFSVGSNVPITAADSILSAFGKAQGQIDGRLTAALKNQNYQTGTVSAARNNDDYLATGTAKVTVSAVADIKNAIVIAYPTSYRSTSPYTLWLPDIVQRAYMQNTTTIAITLRGASSSHYPYPGGGDFSARWLLWELA